MVQPDIEYWSKTWKGLIAYLKFAQTFDSVSFLMCLLSVRGSEMLRLLDRFLAKSRSQCQM